MMALMATVGVVRHCMGRSGWTLCMAHCSHLWI